MKHFNDERIKFLKMFLKDKAVIVSDIKQDILINMQYNSKIKIKKE